VHFAKAKEADSAKNITADTLETALPINGRFHRAVFDCRGDVAIEISPAS
jgi:hypothetical protein